MQDKTSGLLKNGNHQGDPNSAPRCGAQTRKDEACGAPAMKNGRCRHHGGKSTGPRTPEGLERSRKANWKHDLYSKSFSNERKNIGAIIKFVEGLATRGDIDPTVIDGSFRFLISCETPEMEPRLGGVDFEKLDTDQRLKLYKKTLNLHNRELKGYAKLLGKMQRQKKK